MRFSPSSLVVFFFASTGIICCGSASPVTTIESAISTRGIPYIQTTTNMCALQTIPGRCMASTFETGGFTDIFVYDRWCNLLGWHNGVPNGVTQSVSSELPDYVVLDVGTFSNNVQMWYNSAYYKQPVCFLNHILGSNTDGITCQFWFWC